MSSKQIYLNFFYDIRPKKKKVSSQALCMCNEANKLEYSFASYLTMLDIESSSFSHCIKLLTKFVLLTFSRTFSNIMYPKILFV